MALIDDVNEGGVCQEGPTNGNIYCAFVPADVYECCGPGRTVLDCMSSLCCGADDVVEPEASSVPEPPELTVPEGFGSCVITDEQPCSLEYLRENQGDRAGWVIFPPNTVCVDGSNYAFQVFPGPPSDRVLLWFQGGGGCWDYESCFREDIALATTSVSLNSQGIFNLANETNPIVRGNWTIVHANYCSGDLFIGNATQEFKALNSSATGTATFGGANNTLAVLDWMAAQEFGPESAGARRRVVGGCSAGSLATQLWARVLQEQYGFHQLLLDSFVGYFPAYARAFFPTAYGACSAGQQEAMWDDEFVEVCKAGGADIVEFTKETLRMYPDLEASYIGFTEDIIQKAFYVIGAGNYTNKTAFIDAAAHIQANFAPSSLQLFKEYSSLNEQFVPFLINGEDHCILNRPTFYREDMSSTIDGDTTTVLQEVEAYLNDDIADPPEPGMEPPSNDDGSNARAAGVQMFVWAMALLVAWLLCARVA
eukprot:jgi/Tetstr1/424992/TSEL_015462.t1